MINDTARNAVHDRLIDSRKADASRQRSLRVLRGEANADEYERTRHSNVFEGMELGFVRPTAQTESKLRRDPVDTLSSNGRISKAQVKAAQEIRLIYETLVCSMLARASSPERVGGGRGQMPGHIADLHMEHYLPWAYYLGGRPYGAHPLKDKFMKIPKRGRCRPALESAISVVVDGLTLAACETLNGWRHGFASEVIDYALAVYSEFAGWEQHKDKINEFEHNWRKRARAMA